MNQFSKLCMKLKKQSFIKPMRNYIFLKWVLETVLENQWKMRMNMINSPDPGRETGKCKSKIVSGFPASWTNLDSKSNFSSDKTAFFYRLLNRQKQNVSEAHWHENCQRFKMYYFVISHCFLPLLLNTYLLKWSTGNATFSIHYYISKSH